MSEPATMEQIHALLKQQGEDIARLAQRIPPTPAPILTLAEAVVHTRCDSDSAFYRWCSKWRVTASAHGRYARRALDAGLHRESMASVKRRKRATPAPTHAQPVAA